MLPVTCSFILALYLYLCILSKIHVSAIPVNFKPCTGVSGTIQSLDLSPCTQQPCVFQHGVNATVTLGFTPGFNSTTLKTEVFGLIAGVPLPFPMSNPDACTGCGVTCPVVSGTKYIYNNTLPVLKQYPNLKVVVKWQLVGEDDNIVACVLFPIAIETSADYKQLQDSNKSQFIKEYQDSKLHA